MDCSLPGFWVHGIFQARTLERVAISFSRGSSPTKDWTWISCVAGRFFTNWGTRTLQNLDPLNVFSSQLVPTEPPATSPSQLHVFLQVRASLLESCLSLQLGGSSLLCNLSSLRDLTRIINLQFVQLFFLIGRVVTTTPKPFTHQTGGRKVAFFSMSLWTEIGTLCRLIERSGNNS